MNIALFASGSGSNVAAILAAVKAGQLKAKIVGLVCDNPQAFVIERVKSEAFPVLVFSPSMCQSREAWEREILSFLKAQATDLVVLAGFMRILGPQILMAYPQAVINLHPALLPLFPGRHGIEEAYQAGVNETGITIHYVDEGIDTGPIIAQYPIKVKPSWSIDELANEIHRLEHYYYPLTIQRVIEEKQKKE